MLKTLVGLAAVLVLPQVASSALADPPWARFSYTTNGSKLVLVYGSGAEGWDPGKEIIQSVSNPAMAYLAIWHESGVAGWDGPSAFYLNEIKPNYGPGSATSYDGICLWAGSEVQAQELDLRHVAGGIQYPPYKLDPPLVYRLRLVSVPEGVVYNGPYEWGPDHGVLKFPFYSTSDGRTGYRFQAEITYVPEPCSLTALACCLGLLAGMPRRRG